MKNFIFITLLFVISMFNKSGYCYDSFLSISVGSGDMPSKVQYIVIDSQGRKTGFKSLGVNKRTGSHIVNKFMEIPNAQYGPQSIGTVDPETNEVVGSGPESLMFEFRDVFKDTYTLRFIGLDNSTFTMQMMLEGPKGEEIFSIWDNPYYAYISSGTTHDLKLFIDPTPGAPPPVLTKVVTFQTIKDDFNVALKLNHIGDEKFVRSLVKMVEIAERLYTRCVNWKDEESNKGIDIAKRMCYKPVIAILRLVVKRLEVVNKLCNEMKGCKAKCKVSKECDEEEAWKLFDTKYRKDKYFSEFFNEWDKDEWHKHKKTCKRFVSDDALEIISADINWLIKSFGDEIWQDYKKEHEPYIPERYKDFLK